MSQVAGDFEPVAPAPSLLRRAGDLDTYFVCGKSTCAGVCSSLARHCPVCGEPVDFDVVYASALQTSGVLAACQPVGEPAKLELSRFGARNILYMKRFKGFLLLGTEGAGLLVLNIAKPSGMDAQQFLPGESVHSIVEPPGSDARQVYLIAHSGVHVLDFLPHPSVREVPDLDLSAQQAGAPVAFLSFIEAGAVLFEPQSADGPTRLTLLPKDGGERQHAEVPGVASRPIATNGGGLAFFGSSAVYLCPPDGLQITENPARDSLDSREPLHRMHASDTGFIVPAHHDLRHFDIESGALTPFGPDLKEPYLLASGWDRPWVVAIDQEGIKVIEVRTGAPLGDSRSQLNFPMSKLEVLPLLGSDRVFFVALMRNGASQLLVVPLTAEGRVDSTKGAISLHSIGFAATGIMASPSGILVAEVSPRDCSLTRVGVGS